MLEPVVGHLAASPLLRVSGGLALPGRQGHAAGLRHGDGPGCAGSADASATGLRVLALRPLTPLAGRLAGMCLAVRLPGRCAALRLFAPGLRAFDPGHERRRGWVARTGTVMFGVTKPFEQGRSSRACHHRILSSSAPGGGVGA